MIVRIKVCRVLDVTLDDDKNEDGLSIRDAESMAKQAGDRYTEGGAAMPVGVVLVSTTREIQAVSDV